METRETFLTYEALERGRPLGPMPHRQRIGAGALAATGFLGVLLVLVTFAVPARGPAAPGYGAGIFLVDGRANATFSLVDGGTYYLGVGTDDLTAHVDAKLSYNGTLAAEVNGTGSRADLVSLPAGNYSLALEGHGRAALGWDFTNGSLQTFADNATATAFLRPASAHVQLTVALGDAQEIRLDVYDDRLLPVTSANVTFSGGVSVDLPATHATAAYVVATVRLGNPYGLFGLAWSSPAPTPAAPDLGAQLVVTLLWIGIPIVAVLLVFLALHRQRRDVR